MYTVKIQMYPRTFATEDDIGMSKHVLYIENCCFLLKKLSFNILVEHSAFDL